MLAVRHYLITNPRLRDPKQAHPVHLDAEPLQLDLSRGGARDDAHSQGMLVHFAHFSHN